MSDEKTNDQNAPGPRLPDPAEWSAAMANIAERSQNLVAEFLERQQLEEEPTATNPDPLNIGTAFMEMTARLMADPTKLWEAQFNLWQDYLALWQSTTQKMMGEEAEPVATPDKGDRRFKNEAWEENEVFDFIKQSYLLTSRWMHQTVTNVEGLEEKDAQKVDFYTRQFVDAMAPNNFLMTNPEVLQATIESGGENLLKGLQNLLDDLERGKGRLAIKMTDYDAFKVGDNLAVTPGKVVYQNDLMQLIQYSPTTEEVHKVPLLVIPPWINKFYILDLREKNSFIKWAVSEGYSVFVISWVNPDGELANKSFGDYMMEGPIAAMEAIEAATGESDVNIIGYCLGGTLLATTLAYLHNKGPKDVGPDPKRIKSATFFTTMTDFSKPGELGIFVDEPQIQVLENQMENKGYLEGSSMATTFNMLRSNDLIWSFVVNNYLMGKDPFPFDLLYWNSDSTRMPAAMHSFYLRNMYQENRLAQPGGIELFGVPIDLGKIQTPIYMLSTREDHIAPWEATYALTQLTGGSSKFVLAASGHIAGVVNPPAANKYCFWTNTKKPADPQTWLQSATQKEGSWWPDWKAWSGRHSGKKVPARVPGEGKLKVIEDAPGSYVLVKSDS